MSLPSINMKIQNRTPTLPNYITASSNVWGPEKYGRFLLLVFNVYLAVKEECDLQDLFGISSESKN